MTPILFGRWQTRIFLLATVGILVSLPFALGVWSPPPRGEFHSEFFWVVFYVGLFGIGWDILYNFLQQYMWDRDWPGVFQFFGAIAEGIFLGVLIKFIGLPFLTQTLDLRWFIIHYTLVSVIAYLLAWVVMRLLFPRWRFRGGQWL